MYDILIIDDERIITKGVKSKIGRMQHPLIGAITEHYDPVEALNFIREHRPSIVITDMEMPAMSGLDLVSETMKFFPEAVFIVLSGYDNYNYVRQSFQLGVIDYLLKPVATDELHQKVSAAIESIESSKSIQDPLDTEVSSALHRIGHSADLNETANDINYVKGLLDKRYFQLASVSLPHNYQLSDVNRITQDMIHLIGDEAETIQYFDEFSNSILVLNFEEQATEMIIARKLTQFLNRLKHDKKEEAKIALTKPIADLLDFAPLLTNLQSIIKAKIQYPPYKLMIHENSYEDNSQAIKEMIAGLNKWFLVKDYQQILEFVDRFFVLKTTNYKDLHLPAKIYNIILLKLNERLKTSDLYDKKLYDKSYESFDSLLTLRIYLKGSIIDIQKMSDAGESSSLTIIDAAIRYIKENIEKDINMAQVSNHLSLNYSYFSKLFKDRMGVSFKKYIIQLKMDYAKQLLEDPTIRIYEVAQRVGYDNAQNFSRAFKGHFGFSPKAFRSHS